MFLIVNKHFKSTWHGSGAYMRVQETAANNFDDFKLM